MKVVGITSCTVGIAHTYMAREKLIETGKKLGFDVKIETQGSGGTVSGTERFKGQPLVKVPVSTAIKSPEGLLKQIQAKLNK